MYADRALTLLAHPDQWARCAHDGTVLLPDGGVGLDWAEPGTPSRWDGERCLPAPVPPPGSDPAGLAFDEWCRAWVSRPAAGRVEALETGARETPARDATTARLPAGLRHPTGVAVDGRRRLYVCETAGGAVLVADALSLRVLRRVPVPGRPVDAVASGCRGLVLTAAPDALLVLDGRVGPRPGPAVVPPCGRAAAPVGVTTVRGRPVLLWRDAEDRRFVAAADGALLAEVSGATAIAGMDDGLLVVARGPGAAFLRWRLADDGALVEDEPLRAEGYDGAAVAIDPVGRVAYTTPRGVRRTQGSAARHRAAGTVTTYRLDSGTYGNRWGRVLLDACLPTGTGLRVSCVTSDEDDVDDPIDARPAARGARRVPVPEQTPPQASAAALAASPAGPVFRRPGSGDGSSAGDAATYECPVDAPAGRYLWVRLHLAGTDRSSPRVGAVRVEHPGHQLLASLPAHWSTVEAEAAFLHRFLMPAEGLLHELDTAAAERSRLVDPRTTPTDLLPWLASFAGLALDRRWSEEARRQLVAEAYPLYARRGTRAALERMLALYLGRSARIVERWRLRGLGGAVLGLTPGGLDAPTVAGNARASGMLGHFTVGGQTTSSTSYRTHAHRFTVLVPGRLDAEQRRVVAGIVERQKPAHTVVDVCELGDGLPVGRLRLDLTAYVGPCRTRPAAVLGRTRVGLGGTLGEPRCGSRVSDTRVGQVRLG